MVVVVVGGWSDLVMELLGSYVWTGGSDESQKSSGFVYSNRGANAIVGVAYSDSSPTSKTYVVGFVVGVVEV